MWDVLNLIKEQRKQAAERELWRRYMANIVPMWGTEETQTYTEALENFNAINEPKETKAQRVRDARRTAEETLQAFNMSRR